MPEMNGFRFASLLHDIDISIKVVFVCDEYAIQAFEMSTLDDLKKPVTVASSHASVMHFFAILLYVL